MNFVLPPLAAQQDIAPGVMTQDVPQEVAQDFSVSTMGDASMSVGEPTEDDLKISVYAESITSCSSREGDNVLFDIVFNVGSYSDGVSTTYQTVKRICVDKRKLFDEVQQMSPVSVVEDAAKEELKKPTISQTQIFKRLAGL